MIKLFGNPMSTCTRKVLMTLVETDTPYEMSVVDLSKAEHKGADHLRRQPFGRVPALDDGGFEMFESRAMCRYLNEKASGKLIPSDLQARARMEQWISTETSEFSGPALKLIFEHLMKRPQEPAVLEAATKALETTTAVMDAQLAKTPFLVGQDLTLADICFMPYVDYLMATPAKELFAKHPHVMAWWTRVSDRASWKAATGKA
ncbi:MAG: glutathione S-transferase N-terminal domain-containing protein [Labilithrix sp.]|nr:glutathione S-transferase N-terminal domain-containing protein [Labilithrix sp.]